MFTALRARGHIPFYVRYTLWANTPTTPFSIYNGELNQLPIAELISSTNQALGFDFASIVNGFLSAPACQGGPSQRQVVGDFTTYLNAYTAWAGSSFSDNGLYNAALAAYSTMMTDVNSLQNNLPY